MLLPSDPVSMSTVFRMGEDTHGTREEYSLFLSSGLFFEIHSLAKPPKPMTKEHFSFPTLILGAESSRLARPNRLGQKPGLCAGDVGAGCVLRRLRRQELPPLLRQGYAERDQRGGSGVAVGPGSAGNPLLKPAVFFSSSRGLGHIPLVVVVSLVSVLAPTLLPWFLPLASSLHHLLLAWVPVGLLTV